MRCNVLFIHKIVPVMSGLVLTFMEFPVIDESKSSECDEVTILTFETVKQLMLKSYNEEYI